jgi:hypothetical protein
MAGEFAGEIAVISVGPVVRTMLLENTMDDIRNQEEVLELQAPTTLILGEEGGCDYEDVTVPAGDDAFGTF